MGPVCRFPPICTRVTVLAKKKTTRRTSSTRRKRSDTNPQPGPLEELGRRLDALPEIRTVEEALATARDELDKAQSYFRGLREDSQARLDKLRGQELGDLADVALDQVRKRPGWSLFASFCAGLVLAAWFRRR